MLEDTSHYHTASDAHTGYGSLNMGGMDTMDEISSKENEQYGSYLNMGVGLAPDSHSPEFVRYDKYQASIKQRYVPLPKANIRSESPNVVFEQKRNSPSRKSAMASTVKNDKMSTLQMTQDFAAENDFVVIDGTLFIYDKEGGMFLPLNKANSDPLIRRQSPNHVMQKLNSYAISEISAWLKSRTDWLRFEGREIRRINSKYVNFKNLTVELPGIILHSHSPRYCCTNVLNANLDTDVSAFEDSIFSRVLDDFFEDGEASKLLTQEFFSTVICNMQLKKFFFITGKSDSGKSFLIDLLRFIIGTEYPKLRHI